MYLLTRVIHRSEQTGQAGWQMAALSLLSGPPGPLVPREVRSVGLHPRLRAPLLRYVVAPTWWGDKHGGE